MFSKKGSVGEGRDCCLLTRWGLVGGQGSASITGGLWQVEGLLSASLAPNGCPISLGDKDGSIVGLSFFCVEFADISTFNLCCGFL